MEHNKQLTAEQLEEYKAERRAYKKAWRDKNKDRINEYHRQWREQYKQANGISYDQARYLANKERKMANEVEVSNEQ